MTDAWAMIIFRPYFPSFDSRYTLLYLVLNPTLPPSFLLQFCTTI